MKLLEENEGKQFLNMRIGNEFLGMTPKAKNISENNKWDYVKI